ncbi:MAG TPA: ferric reductase-like transmembrane domain-containing protein [Xanthobacteraceae bacterium]|jgi:sulfoxide reductase heme-binding subunit YedZ
MQPIWPWQDRNREFSWLKATTFALMFMPAIWLVYQVATEQFGPVPLGGMTYWSGFWALALLLLALAVTPALTILRWRELILVRRMIGVTALAYTIAHIIIYFALRFWDFTHIAHEMVTRISLILATVATVGLIALGATSLDEAVRRMGAKGWNTLHNTIYLIAALAVIHYLLSPDYYPDQYLTSGMLFWLMLWRVLSRRGQGTDPTALALLAVAACLFTVLLEVAWTWAYHDYAPSETFANNFSLVLGVAPAWKIIVIGLLIAVAAAVRRVPRLRTAGIEGRKLRF